jgi:hypothetical protein
LDSSRRRWQPKVRVLFPVPLLFSPFVGRLGFPVCVGVVVDRFRILDYQIRLMIAFSTCFFYTSDSCVNRFRFRCFGWLVLGEFSSVFEIIGGASGGFLV